ncbi:hypothetical protein DP117_05240 [Brasilonema sp. UFV-L1]|nr:hypothetical protein [Brasilonema sp. UFV-L1]
MRLIDISLLTLINITVCLAFPKILSIIMATKTKCSQLWQRSSKIQKNKTEITSFPFCTSYALTRRPFCKFSPNFCERCSPG